MPLMDPVALSRMLMKTYEKAQPILQDFLTRTSLELSRQNFDPFNMQKIYLEFWENIAAHPDKFIEIQQDYLTKWAQLWQESAKKFLGEPASSVIEPEKGDKRFKAEEWQNSAIFDFIKQSYLLTCEWMEQTVRGAEDLDEHKRKKLAFYTRLFADALSPTNFALTNPEVIRATLESGGENLVKGFENLLADLQRGQGELKISTTNYDAFKLGENIATTPGKVVYQNDLIQLIQYEALTDQVFKRPLLIIPPWINKYYILDLRQDNSLIRWCAEQGHTVFTISWVNPDKKLAQKGFDDYMSDGILQALDEIKRITGAPDCNAVGYCLGGTLLASTLAWLTAKKQEKRVASATFLTTLIDFAEAGDLKLFMDEEQIASLDRDMAEKGFLESKQLQRTFSLLRANDLIWSFVINNYLMGKEPFPFDLLYWNDDSTNMPAAMHSFYLRNMYRDNLLVQPGGLTLKSVPIDIGKVKTPSYFLSTREDHIAPWKATYAGTHLPAGPVSFTLAASGHIAGVVNPPAKQKYCYWTAAKRPADPDQWMESAKQHEGSWWPHWQNWIKAYTGDKVPARKIKKSLESAPGSYVLVKGS